MSKLKSLGRKLKERNVWIAQEMEKRKNELAKKLVEEQVKKDAEFARDVLKAAEVAISSSSPQEIKEAAEETISRVTEEKQELGT